MPTLQGKVALVTGASYGVGRAVSIGLSREGCEVILAARDQEKLAQTKRRIEQMGYRATVCRTDMAQIDEVHQLGQLVKNQYGRLDILVHCAFGHIGEDIGKSLLDVTPDELKDFGLGSIVGSWWVARELAPMLQASGGRMVFVVADWGWPQHNVFLTTTTSATTQVGSEAFISAKHAITGLANTIERKLGIPTTGIYPGIIASIKPSSQDQAEPEYFDIDDPIDTIEAEESYRNGWAIPLIDIVDSVTFALKRYCVTKAIFLKPSNSDYEGLGLHD